MTKKLSKSIEVMLNSLNTQFLYSQNGLNKFYQNRKLIDDENTICDPPMNGSTGSPVSEIDQYLTHLIQSTQNNQAAFGHSNFKTEDTRMTHTDCEDSGFMTSHSSPQLSPMSASSLHSGVDTNQSCATPPYDDYTQLSFQGVANNQTNWNLNLDQNSPIVAKEIKLFSNYPSKSALHNCELKIVKQPESHHRARYMTEGSRGTIKDRTGRGYPVVQLYGYSKCGVKLQCFIGHDQKVGEPHLFYQACEVSGKTAYKLVKVDGVNMIELDLLPKNNMQTVLDCMGILKERNVDVERKVLRSRRKSHTRPVTANEEAKVIRNTNKSRSTHCRMVFRCILPDTGEILQVVSDPILCTQPLGSPEIYKMSLRESDTKGGHELYIIGKNFHKDSKVIFSSGSLWRKVVNPMKEFLNSTHLICTVPTYDAIDARSQPLINVDITVHCNHKTSDPMKFIYSNSSFAVNTVNSELSLISFQNS